MYALTADTHGTAALMCKDLPLEIMTFPCDSAMNEKLKIVTSLGAEHCVTNGNGRNDVPMCQAAALSIAVIGIEGVYGKLLNESDVCVSSIADALNLLLFSKTLVNTLRG